MHMNFKETKKIFFTETAVKVISVDFEIEE